MSVHKAAVTLTADANGHAEDDIHIHPSINVRHAWLETIHLDVSSCFAPFPLVTVSELDDVSAETWNDSTEDFALGRQLAHIDTRLVQSDGMQMYEYDPRHNIISRFGDIPTYDVLDAPLNIQSAYLRVEADGLEEGDELEVVIHYRTAGDWRF